MNSESKKRARFKIKKKDELHGGVKELSQNLH
jgi:hypothetical protein